MSLTTSLTSVLHQIKSPTIAVSGGVDSTTLAEFARQEVAGTAMVHAVSPAVPQAATARVRALAAARGWRLSVVDAGEFQDERYLVNPVDRCFYCKTNLYETLGRLAAGSVCSGANTDDLDDFRPGLQAAANHGVRHPYIDAAFSKTDVRALARQLELPDLAELPASPCLASRLETGLRVAPDRLRLVEDVEAWLQARLNPHTVRCRLRRDGVEIEIDDATLAKLSAVDQAQLIAELRPLSTDLGAAPIRLSRYRRGSAFVGERSEPA